MNSLQHLPIALFHISLEGHIIYANEFFYTFTGLKKDNISQKDWIKIFQSDSKDDKLQLLLNNNLPNNKTISENLILKLARGDNAIVHFEAHPYKDESNSPTFYSCCLTDITSEMKLIEAYERTKAGESPDQILNSMDLQHLIQKLKADEACKKNYEKIEFENRTWRVIDRVNTNLVVLNGEQDLLSVLLQIVCEDMDWDVAQIYLKKTTDDITNMNHRQSYTLFPKKFENFIKKSEELSFELNNEIPGTVWANRTPLWIDNLQNKKSLTRSQIAIDTQITTALGLPIFVKGEIYGILEVFSKELKKEDPTQLRGMSVIATYFGRELEKQIQIKIDSDYKESVAHNAKMLSMGQMASGIAHEINNPLTIIKGNLNGIQIYLKENPIQIAKALQSVEKVNKTVERIVKIIRGLKNLSRDGSGDPFVSTPISQIIEDAISFTENKIKFSGVEIIIPEYDNKLAFECRSYQIGQILINLISNAIDAIETLEEKWIQLDIIDLQETNKIMICVTDSGNGIPKHIADKMMETFFTTKAPGKGTGLGLSIIRGIINAHNGDFTLDNQSPKTRFVITLPKKQPEIN